MDKTGFNRDLREILYMVLKRLWLFLIFALAGGIISLFVSAFLIKPVYRSGFTVSVYNTEQVDQKMSSSDIYASQLLMPSCSIVMKSRTVLEAVAQELGDGTTAEDLYECIKITRISDTNILKATVETKNPELSYAISEKMSAIAPELVSKLMRTGTLVILDSPFLNYNAFGLNKIMSFLLGILSGLSIGFIMVLILYKTDKTIKGIDDLRKTYSIPVLGEIPYYNSNIKNENNINKGKMYPYF